jgi:hypothetical protein
MINEIKKYLYPNYVDLQKDTMRKFKNIFKIKIPVTKCILSNILLNFTRKI